MSDAFFMVFDVESIGLHGDGFAVGFVVVNQSGEEQESGLYQCGPDEADGPPQSRTWISKNVVPALAVELPRTFGKSWSASPASVRESFWQCWMKWKNQGARLAADVAWPVEANFLRQCIKDAADREWDGPYPLLDIASIRFAVGLDPLGTEERKPNELPAHNPLADARQSARLLLEALTPSAAEMR